MTTQWGVSDSIFSLFDKKWGPFRAIGSLINLTQN